MFKFILLITSIAIVGCSESTYIEGKTSKASCTYDKLSFAWDYDTTNDRLKDFRLFYGKENRFYDDSIDSGSKETKMTINVSDFADENGEYFFALKAVDTNDKESDGYSNEVSASVCPPDQEGATDHLILGM